MGRSHYNRVSGVDPNRVDIFHRADHNLVAGVVPYNFKFNFLPTGNTLFNKDLVDPGPVETTCGDFRQFFLVLGNSAPGASQGKGRPDYYRVAQVVGVFQGFIQTCYRLGWNQGFVNFFHEFSEEFPVFPLLDAGNGRSQNFYIVLVQDSLFMKVHGQVQASLSPHSGNQVVRSFFFNNLFHHIQGHGLNVDLVGHAPVGHNGGGVGVN